MAIFWGLEDFKKKYFLKLVDYCRAGNVSLKSFYKKELAEIKNQAQKLENIYANKKPLQELQVQQYYSNWMYTAIHILTSIPRYQYANEISKRLNIPENTVSQILEKLEKFNCVKRSTAGWKIKNTDMHLSNSSHMNIVNQQNWHQRALLNILKNEDESLHYNAVHSLSEKTYFQIKSLILILIEESRKLVSSSSEEECVCINFNLFKV